jgi:hypothetical protein
MKKIAFGFLALAGICVATPTLAQGVYFGAGPGGVGVGIDDGYRGDRYYRGGYYDDGPRFRRHYRETYGYSGSDCRTKIVRYSNGVTRRIRRCY